MELTLCNGWLEIKTEYFKGHFIEVYRKKYTGAIKYKVDGEVMPGLSFDTTSEAIENAKEFITDCF